MFNTKSSQHFDVLFFIRDLSTFLTESGLIKLQYFILLKVCNCNRRQVEYFSGIF